MLQAGVAFRGCTVRSWPGRVLMHAQRITLCSYNVPHWALTISPPCANQAAGHFFALVCLRWSVARPSLPRNAYSAYFALYPAGQRAMTACDAFAGIHFSAWPVASALQLRGCGTTPVVDA